MPKSFDVRFNAEARRTYLTSFSSKKKQRRAFGLAMQKVKNRREKLAQRKEHRERLAAEADELNGLNDDQDNTGDWIDMKMGCSHEDKLNESEGLDNPIKPITTNPCEETQTAKTLTTKFVDPLTHANYGGEVIVTTTFDIPDDQEDFLDVQPMGQKHGKGVDVQQRFAGSVKKYLNDKLPSKKRRLANSGGAIRKKGKHGAEGMRGIGSAKDLKLAQKTLNQAKSKIGHTHGRHSDGKRKKGGRK